MPSPELRNISQLFRLDDFLNSLSISYSGIINRAQVMEPAVDFLIYSSLHHLCPFCCAEICYLRSTQYDSG